jgi:Ca-activated chloride channel family protein
MAVFFEQPVYLWLSIFIPVLIFSHFFFLSRTQKKALRFANFETIKRIANERFVTKNVTLLILRIIVFSAIILALAGTTYTYTGTRNDFDYVIALDTSASMLADDIEPNRFTAAKEASLIFLDTLRSDADIGFVSFSGVTFARNELGSSRNAIRLSIVTTNISRVSGTDIASAVVTSSNMFLGSDRSKAVILITDGVNTAGPFIDNAIVQAADYALRNNIVIHTVGLGTSGASPGFLPSSFNLTSSLDRESLEFLANETGGSSIFPQSTQELNEYFQELDEQTNEGTISLELNRYLFMLAFSFLIIEWILINLIFRRVI